MATSDTTDSNPIDISTFPIRESGGSIVVTIDRDKLQESGLEVGDQVIFDVPDDDDRNLELVNASDALEFVR